MIENEPFFRNIIFLATKTPFSAWLVSNLDKDTKFLIICLEKDILVAKLLIFEI